MASWSIKNPDDGSSLETSGDSLVSETESRFDIVDDIPLLLPNKPDTMDSIVHSRNGKKIFPNDPFVVDSLGLTDEEKSRLRKAIAQASENSLDPIASFMIGATCGNAYQDLRSKVKSYPIPFETDCFFGIGLQYSDIGMVKTIYKPFFFHQRNAKEGVSNLAAGDVPGG